MSNTTQTRILWTTHERLARLADETGRTHQDVIDVALRAYERNLFLENLNKDFALLRSNESAWAEEVEERAEWDSTLGDADPE
jgi:hypothetical protein